MKRKRNKVKNKVDGRYLRKAWTNFNNVAAFRNVTAFAKSRKITDYKKVEEELSQLESFSRHRATLKNIKRRPIILHKPLQLVQADLIDVKKYKRLNSGYGWIFISVDPFSKLIWAHEIRNKTADEMVTVLKKMLKFYKFQIQSFQSDFGNEFFAKKVQNFLKKKAFTNTSLLAL